MRAARRLYRAFQQEHSPEGRACRLLKEWLSARQYQQLATDGYFEVVGCHSGKRYRIHSGTLSNVFELDDLGQPTMGLCFVPDGALVAGDVMLAQKIALETDERAALATANRFLQRPPRPSHRVVRRAY